MIAISCKTLMMAIQATEAEIRRLRAVPDAMFVAEDAVLLVDFETAAEELEAAYANIIKTDSNLPSYSMLVGRPSKVSD